MSERLNEWLVEEISDIIIEMRGARYVSMHAGYGDYDLPSLVVKVLEDLLTLHGHQVPPEEQDEDDSAEDSHV